MDNDKFKKPPLVLRASLTLWLCLSVIVALLLLGCDVGASRDQNLPPHIDAGPLLLAESGQVITLVVGAYDPDGEIRDYQWRQLGGVAVTMSQYRHGWLNIKTPQVTERELLRFELTVTDDQGASYRAAKCVLLLPKSAVSAKQPTALTADSVEGETACNLQLLADLH